MAERNAEFLLRELRQEDGRLLRTWKQGEAKLDGYLEDYSYLIEGLLELYQTIFDAQWFETAQQMYVLSISRTRRWPIPSRSRERSPLSVIRRLLTHKPC